MFSLNWFTTIPGLLITGGVLLLVIALVIFIVTSKKEKKKNDGVNTSNGNAGVVPNPNEAQPISVDPIPMQGVPMAQPSAIESSPVIVPTVMNEPVSDNFSNPSIGVPIDNLSVDQSLNAVSPVESVASMPSVEVPPVNTQEVANESIGVSPSVPDVSPVSVTTPTMPEVQPAIVDTSADSLSQGVMAEPVTIPTISEVPSAPTVSTDTNISEVVAPSVEQVVPELQDVGAPTISTVDTYSSPYNSDNLQSAPSTTPIYGGADPVVSDVVVNQENPQIYGGANPLEGTQSIPVSPAISEVSAQQASAIPTPTPISTPTVDVNTPVVEQPAVVQTPVEPVSVPNNMVNSVPTVDSVVPNYTVQQPAVSNEPVVNPINNNFTYQSATAPQVQLPTDGNIQ